MTIDAAELLRRIRAGESTRLELKRGLPSDERLARALAAFANTKGGLLVVGVEDDGALHGVPDPEFARAELVRVARERVRPPLRVHVQCLAMGSSELVGCFVGASADAPHEALSEAGAGEVCVRIGSSTRAASSRRIASLHGRAAPSGIERAALEWIGEAGGAFEERAPGAVSTTAAMFAREHATGRQRAKRAFLALERAGWIAGSGEGDARVHWRL